MTAARGAAGRRGRRPRPVRLHDDAGDPDADRGREDRSRSRADRMEGPEYRERDIRGHGAGAAAPAATDGHPSDGRDDLQSGRTTRRSRLAGHVHRVRRRRHRRAARQPPAEPAAARHPRRQDPAHRAGPARAHGDEHGQRERPVSDSQRQSVFGTRGRAKGDLGVRPAQPAPDDLGRRSGAAAGAACCSRSTSGSPRGRRSSSSGRARTTAIRCAKARR